MGAIEATDTDYQNSWAFETKQIHAGWDRDPQTGATSIPILQTTSFAFDSAERAAARFALQELGPIYTRLGNPTNDYVEARIAALEGGVGALLTSSGQSAITLAILNLASAGNNIVASPSLYGGSTSLLNNTLRRLGIDARFVSDPYDVDEWLSLADENTVAFYGETIPNPKGDIFDIEKIAQAAHSVGVPLIVDNTVATPYLTRPIEWGADIVVHSATKYLGGHGTAISGAIVDAGNFDYTKDPKRFPGFNEPESSYAGLESSPYYELHQKYNPRGAGGLLSFVIKGGLEAGTSFATSLKLLPTVANIGDAKSLVIHPASTTHSQLNEEQLRAAGIEPGTVRLSIGIENVNDIIADLTQGFEAVAHLA